MILELPQNFVMMAHTDSRISRTVGESCIIANTDSIILGTVAEFCMIALVWSQTPIFQNFWNCHRFSVWWQLPLFQNFWNCHRFSVERQLPIPDFLDLSQNFCMTAQTDSRVPGTAALILYDRKQRFQIFWSDQKVFVFFATDYSLISMRNWKLVML